MFVLFSLNVFIMTAKYTKILFFDLFCSMESIIAVRKRLKATKNGRKESQTNKEQIKTKMKLKST